MKCVMLSIQPKWCELIASGKKTIEVRKTAPKLQTPFMCYIYETKGLCDTPTFIDEDGHISYRGRGQVIGEFVCDRIDRLYIPISTSATPPDKEAVEKATCLSLDELKKYANGKMFLYGLHISNLKIYDTPKELGEFKTPPCEKPDTYCHKCKYFAKIDTHECYETSCWGEDGVPLTRPPQSWCYVEELSE